MPAALGATALLGCGNAPDTVKGGDPLLGVAPLATDSGGLLDASSACQPGGSHGGHTWTDLYACYFGPSGVVSCSSQTTCHGAANQQGGLASKYVCGPMQSDCYQGMLEGGLVTPGSTAAPEGSLLYIVLCKDDPSSPGGFTGIMPKNCPPGSRLQAGDLARIGAWVQEGAPSD
jgi:hypothetical protein